MSIPKFLFGVYTVPPEQTKATVIAALDAGYPGIDTATWYNNEQESVDGIVEFLEMHPDVTRDDIFYSTKISPPNFGYDAAKKAIHASYEKAYKLGYIDLYLMHTPHGGPELRSETWRALEEAQAEGLVKHIGVANWEIRHLEELIDKGRAVPCVNQITISPWQPNREIVEFDQRHGIVTEAWNPMQQTWRTKDSKLEALAHKYDKTSAQILIHWAAQCGAVPVSKTTSPKLMKEHLDALNFTLSHSDFETLGQDSRSVSVGPS